MASASASLPSLQLAAFVSLCQLRGCLKVGNGIIALAGAFRIVSQGIAKACGSDLSVFPQTEAEPVVGFADGRKKWGFPAAFREETLYRVGPSYAEHSVFTSLGEIKQPCPRSLRVRGFVLRFFLI